jgi:aspartyl-tRNA(Asn)/glutamyl-tRNA(Gln) amidotransferase subunit C
MPKVKVDKELLLKVAKNSRLNLSEQEVKKFLPQMQEILEAFSKIDEVETQSVKPSFQPLEVKNIYRQDKAGKSFSQEQALSLAKHKKDGYFKGPKVVSE